MARTQTHDVENCIVISASSYLTGHTGEDMERQFKEKIELGNRHFVINFKETEIINSIGISIIIGIIEKILEQKGTIRFANLSKVNEEIFRMMGLLKYAPLVKEGN